MTNAEALRERAETCRAFAREYHPSVARPLYEKARELEREAALIERGGRERRRNAGAPVLAVAPRPLFGRSSRGA